MQDITGKTKLLGVIGHPVEHSLSPVMHNAAITHLGVDYVYLPFPVRGEALGKAVAGLEAIGVTGFNVTLPHKQAILPLLSAVSPEARMVGAANTIWRGERGWQGTNTDVGGFLAPLKTLGRHWPGIAPVILGCGGAARAAVAGCLQLGCPEIHVVGRDPQKLEKFHRSWLNSPVREVLAVHPWEELPGLISEAQLLVNATPVGMSPQASRSPVAAELMDRLPASAIAYDLIYVPSPTEFLKQAKQRGAIAMDGLEMLVQQGAAALQIWLQQPAPVEVMRQSLIRWLGL